MKVVETNKWYAVLCNGKMWGKTLKMQEFTAVNFAQNAAIEWDGDKDVKGNFKQREFSVKEIDLDKCPTIYKVTNTDKKRMK